MHHILRVIQLHFDLFQNDALFFFKIGGVKTRMKH